MNKHGQIPNPARPRKTAEEIEPADAVARALSVVPKAQRDRTRKAVILHLAGYRESEIAELLGVVERTLHRDRCALREALRAVGVAPKVMSETSRPVRKI